MVELSEAIQGKEQSPRQHPRSKLITMDKRSHMRTPPTEKQAVPQTRPVSVDKALAVSRTTDKRKRCAKMRCCLFWRHYSVIMWKNLMLRQRRPGFLVAELVAPVAIAGIMLYLCTREKDVYYPDCHSQTISMPSMGLLSFVQSMLCNFAYSCSVTEPPPLQLLANKTAITDLFENGQQLVEDPWIQGIIAGNNLTMPTDEAFKKLNNLFAALKTVLQEFNQTDENNWQPEKENETINVLGMNISLALLNRVGNASWYICGTEPDQNDIGRLVLFLKSLDGLSVTDLSSGTLKRISRSADNDTPMTSSTLNITTTSVPTITESNTSSSAKSFCETMITYLNIGSFQPYTNRMNYFLFGYIYYYPSTPVTDEIMRRATSQHRLLSRLKRTLEHYNEHTRPALDHQLRNGSRVDSFRKLMQFCVTTGSPFSRYCKEALDFLNPYGTESGKMNAFYLLNQLHRAVQFILNILNCANLQRRLIPTTTRQAFEEYLVLFQQPTFPSAIGVDFQRVPSTLDWNNLTNTSEAVFEIALRKIEYTYKFKVFDRNWSPKPRQNPRDGDMNYITTGFIDVQETISQAIVSMAWSLPDLLQRPANPVALYSDPITGQELKLFPTPCYIDRSFLASVAKVIPQLMLFMWILTAMFTVKAIVEEKEQRLKEFTKVMGVSNITHWIAWFTIDFLIMLPCTILITIMIKYGQVLRDSDYGIILLFFMSYAISVIAFTFLCSTFFTRANLGAIVTGMAYFVLYLPTPVILINEASLPEAAYFGASLSSQTAFSLGLYYMLQTESQGQGMVWADLWRGKYSLVPFSTGKCTLMLWVDTAIYLILTWYIEAVYPGKHGVRQPFYFPFTRSYWCESNTSHTQNLEDLNADYSEEKKDPSLFESPPKDATVGVALQKLTKIYKKGAKPSLDELTLNFYANQVTSLLGHNGAGKSTLMSILTGMQAPTSGQALVAGYDIRKQLHLVRDMLGFCPQYNILFDNLTVAEHIHFYAALKGIDRSQIRGEIDQLMDVLGFPDKRNCRSKSLSGGQKRKLSVAIAFVGKTKVVFLDEPTAGVDPYSRRSIWDLVISLKSDRTIILTTHHMDEADILGDRIAIISQGRLKCEGSSLFLKINHGLGYHLILQRACDSSALENDSLHSVVETQEVVKYVQGYMPQAELIDINTTEITFQLPCHYALDGTFSIFFRHLESESGASIPENLSKLGIVAYGLSDTSLEEVFLEMADDPSNTPDDAVTETESTRTEHENLESSVQETANDALQKSSNHAYFVRRRSQLCTLRQSSRIQQFTDGGRLPAPATRQSLLNRQHVFRQPGPESKEMTSDVVQTTTLVEPILKVSVAQQFRAMFPKRFHYFKRYKRGWFIEFLLPVLLVLLAMAFVSIVVSVYGNPPMPISPWLMAPTDGVLSTFYENHMYVDKGAGLTEQVKASQLVEHVAANYEDALRKPYGWTGTRCIPKEDYHFIPEEHSSCAHWTQLPAWSPEAELSAFERQLALNSSQVLCSCSRGVQKCPVDSVQPNPPPHVSLQTTDVFYNLTWYNISDYLIKTRDQFVLQRFGGLSFYTSPDLSLRGAFEQILNPNNSLYAIIGMLTPLQTNGSVTKPDYVWASLADVVRLMLPPPHHKRIWFNNKGYVSAVAYLNMLQNLQLRMVNSSQSSSLSGRKSYGIVIINHPLDRPTDTSLDSNSATLYDVTLILFTILALSFIPANLITFLVTEVHTGSKHLQFVSGLNAYVYWVSAYIWDIISYIIPATLCILMFVAFKKYAYIGADSCGAFIVLFLLYGLATLPMLYPITFIIRTPSTALVVVAVFNVMLGCVTVLVTYLLDNFQLKQPELESTNNALKGFFLIFPQYCFGRGLYELAIRYYVLSKETFGLVDVSDWANPFGWNVIGKHLLALGLETIFYPGLVLLVEQEFFYRSIRDYFHRKYPRLQRKRLRRLHKRLAKLDNDDDSVLADDVKHEQQRVFKLEQSGTLHASSSVSTLRLVKFFPLKKKPSVNQLTFALRPAECFGLLGVNGAGKTTTFRMLTGSLTPTLGNAFVNGYHVIDQKREAHRSLGYCPQFDALLDLLTGRETLTLYARLRGIPEKEVPHAVAQLLNDMSLAPHADKIARAYSGGNRRKLSTAIALLGGPQVIFLDEPTSGMDPVGKRFLWDQITDLLRGGKSIVLTSHSMEECEALCHRLGIMVNGQFRCFGTVQQLKERFGNGYTAEVRLSDRYHAGEHVEQTVKAEFSNAEVNNTQTRCHEYQFGQGVLLSRLFTLLNNLRNEQWIEHYSVRQTTLDQVFVNFTRLQMEQGEDAQNEDELSESEVISTTTVTSGTSQSEVMTENNNVSNGSPKQD